MLSGGNFAIQEHLLDGADVAVLTIIGDGRGGGRCRHSHDKKVKVERKIKKVFYSTTAVSGGMMSQNFDSWLCSPERMGRYKRFHGRNNWVKSDSHPPSTGGLDH